MNKVAAACIAGIVKSTGMSPVMAAQLVKAAADRGLAVRLEKAAGLPPWLNPMNLVRGAGRAVGRSPAVPRRMSPLPTAGRAGVPAAGPAGAFGYSRPAELAAARKAATPVAPAPGPAGAFGYTPPPAAAGAAKAAPHAAPPASRGPGRSVGGRLAGLAAGGGLGTFGVGHLNNDAQDTVGRSINPLTWFGQPNTEEDVFRRNMGKFDEQSQGIKGEMDAALAANDMGKFNELSGKFQSGNFGGSRFGMGGLNPFASRTGGAYQQKALAQQKALQGKFDSEVGKGGPQPGDSELAAQLEARLASSDLLPQHEAAMKKHLEMLRKRMSATPGATTPEAEAIKARMLSSGMRWSGGKPPAPTPSPSGSPTGNYHLGSRPMFGGRAQGFVNNPHDYRDVPQPNFWGPAYNQQSFI